MATLTQGATYDRDSIYAVSTDRQGHYERVSVKVQPAIEAEIAQLVAAKVRDYKTREDFIRNAIIHQLHYEYMQGSAPMAGPVLTAEMMQTTVGRYQKLVETWEATIRNFADTGEALLNAGATEELGELLTKYDQDFVDTDLPVVKQQELQEVFDNLHDRLTRFRRRDVVKSSG